MPTKPDKITLNAAKVMKDNPNFAKDVVRTIINETPALRDELLKAGLVKEVENA